MPGSSPGMTLLAVFGGFIVITGLDPVIHV
jgi:hypothetical protein